MGRQLDWERANKSELKAYDPRPGEEISEHSAKDDQEFLAKTAALKRKRTKYVRSSPRERVIRRLMEAPMTVQERRLRTILAALSRGKSLFELWPSDDASHRLFQRKDVRLRVRIDPQMQRHLIAFSPEQPTVFDWVNVNIAPGALEDRHAEFVAGRLGELVAAQSERRQRRDA